MAHSVDPMLTKPEVSSSESFNSWNIFDLSTLIDWASAIPNALNEGR